MLMILISGGDFSKSIIGFLLIGITFTSVLSLRFRPTPCKDGDREGRCVSPTGCRPNRFTTSRPSRQGTCEAGMECCISDPTCFWAGGTCTNASECTNGPNRIAFPNHDPLDCQTNDMVCCRVV